MVANLARSTNQTKMDGYPSPVAATLQLAAPIIRTKTSQSPSRIRQREFVQLTVPTPCPSRSTRLILRFGRIASRTTWILAARRPRQQRRTPQKKMENNPGLRVSADRALRWLARRRRG